MHIDVIDNLDAYDLLADQWNGLYARDPHAQFFVSWSWLRHWFEITPYRWFVLAARPAGAEAYVAFLPLATVTERRCGVGLRQLLYMGGKPISDYTGFVCDAAHANDAIAAFSRHVADRLVWDWFHAAHVIDERIAHFLQDLDGERMRVRREAPVGCPATELPADWDGFLAQNLSANRRSNLRRRMRSVEELPDFRATLTTPETADRDIDIVLSLWRARWGPLAAHDLDNYRHMLRRTLDDGCLWLRMLWSGNEPVAALTGLLDPVRQEFLYYISGYDERFARVSPGKVVVGWCVRDAIEQGCRRFDFLLGGEAYKTDFFGAPTREAHSFAAQRTDLGSRLRGRLARWFAPARAAVGS